MSARPAEVPSQRRMACCADVQRLAARAVGFQMQVISRRMLKAHATYYLNSFKHYEVLLIDANHVRLRPETRDDLLDS
jgi:hypothetical protein